MLVLSLAVAGAAALALLVYVVWERLGVSGLGLAALRTLGLGALIVLLVNPGRLERGPAHPATVMLDASLSMQAAGGPWVRALDTARALAGSAGVIFRFGRAVASFDTTPPGDGSSFLSGGLAVAEARGGPLYVVTDGEVSDWSTIPPAMVAGVRFVTLPRDTVPDVALLDVSAPTRVATRDSVPFAVTVGTWGSLQVDRARLEIHEKGRLLLVQMVSLPPAPGTARRTVTLPPGQLSAGEHALQIRLRTDGDVEPRDDARFAVLTVTEQPAIVVVVDPADWAGRFLATTLADVSRAAVRAFGRVTADTWVDMRDEEVVATGAVRAAVRGTALVIVVGADQVVPAGWRRPIWRWPATSETARVFEGDWYVSSPVGTSPLAGRLSGVQWDSLPPLTAIAREIVGPEDWVGLEAREGRRGIARPLVLGEDSAGVRRLTMTGAGLWRWALRGGAPMEAYRTLVAAGLDWLLASESATGRPSLIASPVVQQDVPVRFLWHGEPKPDSVTVQFANDSGSFSRVLHFDASGSALIQLAPGTYRWWAGKPKLSGLTVVEEYSDEFHPRVVTAPSGGATPAGGVTQRFARGRWWLFAVAIAALTGEWAWRQRRGMA